MTEVLLYIVTLFTSAYALYLIGNCAQYLPNRFSLIAFVIGFSGMAIVALAAVILATANMMGSW